MTQSQKKLALFLPALYGGGAERTMLSLAQGIAERGYMVELVLSQAEGPYLSDVPDSIQLVDLGKGKVRSSRKTLSRLPALARYMRRSRPDAILAALVQANLIAVCARKLARFRGKLIVNQQNTLSCWADDPTSRFKRWSPRLARRFYPWADRVIGVSQGVADDLVNVIGIPEKCVGVIYNPGITPEMRRRVDAPLDHPWFEPNQPPVILAVGSLTPQKDFPTLLNAFSIVRKSKDARLLILGEGSERSKLEAIVKELGLEQHVGLPGFVDNPYAYMSRAATFVLSSRFEGLPTVLVEALYCGIPLVATDCPSGPREILKGGQLGHLVPMSSPGELAAAMCQSLEAERSKNDEWRPYALESVVDQYIDLLFDLN